MNTNGNANVFEINNNGNLNNANVNNTSGAVAPSYLLRLVIKLMSPRTIGEILIVRGNIYF